VSRADLTIVIVTMWLAACGRDESQQATGNGSPSSLAADSAGPAASRSTVRVAPAVAPAVPPEPEEEPPNEQQAAEKAAREIKKANYKSELTKIAKEIGEP
jgi:hypothetical protein